MAETIPQSRIEDILDGAPVPKPQSRIEQLLLDGGGGVPDNVYTKGEVNSLLSYKVDKVNGKGLSTEDFTTAEKTKLAELTNDYTNHTNKPSINGTTLSGNKTSTDLGLLPSSTRYGASISANKYIEPMTGKKCIDTILKDQNGNAMSTITSDQPVIDIDCDSSGLLVTYPSARASVSLGAAMSGKVDKIQGKGLSTEDFTTAEKTKLTLLSNVYPILSDKPRINGVTLNGNQSGSDLGLVNAEQGKGLSTEDFTAMYKAWLDVSMQSLLNHNGIYRGKDITNVYTIDEMYDMIHSGNFDDLFLGDYFTKSITTDIYTHFTGAEFESGTVYYEASGDINNRTWTPTEDATPDNSKIYATKLAKTENITLMFAAFDYYYNVGDTAITIPHAILIPRGAGFATTAKMNSTNTTTDGYYGSDMHKITLPCYAKSLKSALNNHLLSHRTWLTTAINPTIPSMAGAGMTGASSASAWTTTELQLMNEVQLYGSTVWSSSAYDVGADNEKLPIFNFISPVHFDRYVFWLRSVVSSSYFAHCDSYGYAGYRYASDAIRVRPMIVFG